MADAANLVQRSYQGFAVCRPALDALFIKLKQDVVRHQFTNKYTEEQQLRPVVGDQLMGGGGQLSGD